VECLSLYDILKKIQGVEGTYIGDPLPRHSIDIRRGKIKYISFLQLTALECTSEGICKSIIIIVILLYYMDVVCECEQPPQPLSADGIIKSLEES